MVFGFEACLMVPRSINLVSIMILYYMDISVCIVSVDRSSENRIYFGINEEPKIA